MHEKQIITVNSHALMNFAQCPRKFLLHEIYEPPAKLCMSAGTLYAKFLEIYYKRKMRGKSTLVVPFWTGVIKRHMADSEYDADKLWRAMHRYTQVYHDETWVPIAVEQGFSRIIHEDEDTIFVLEGRPDLIVREGDSIIVVDHKTQASFRQLPSFSHQVMAYVYASGARNFCHNYIILKKDPEYIRKIYPISEKDVEWWRQNVVELLEQMKSSKFLPNFNCMDIYGKCAFINVCPVPSPKLQEFMLNSQFKLREKRKMSWS